MNIIHGTWIPEESESFRQTGGFYLWVESDEKVKKKGKLHPKQLIQEKLKTFLSQTMGLKDGAGDKERYTIKYFTLPSHNQTPLTSPEMAQYEGIDMEEESFQLGQWEVWCFRITPVIKILNEIHFLSLYDSSFMLGKDILFWHHYTQAFKEIILKDQYIPALKYRELQKPKSKGRKKTEDFEIYPTWEIISSLYESNVQKYSACMPMVCLSGSEVSDKKNRLYTAESLLNHFSQSLLQEIVTGTSFTAKSLHHLGAGFLFHCLQPYHTNENAPLKTDQAFEAYKKWLLWRSKLLEGSQASGYYLSFRLMESDHGKEQWQIDFLITSKEDPSLKIELREYWDLDVKSKKAIIKKFEKELEKSLLLNLGQAAHIYEKIWEGLETDKPTGLTLTTEEAHLFLIEKAWVLEDAGYKVIVPSWWTPTGRKRAKIRLKTSLSAGKSAMTGYFSLDSIINYSYELSIGGQSVTKREWEELINAKSPLVKFRGEWMELDKSKMSEMLKFWQSQNMESDEITIADILKMGSQSEEEIEFDHDQSLSEMLAGLFEKSKLQAMETPSQFKGDLRPYQKRGLSWLHYLEGLGLNPCLADDMGLGKTIQVIARMINENEKEKNPPPTLLIAPTSVLGNWRKEVERFAPHLKVAIHHGSNRTKEAGDFREECLKNDLMVTSFALIRKELKLFQKIEWRRVVVDEAQNIKNPKSAQTKAILKLKAQHRMALTGTPIENRLLDLWSIFNFLNPGYLGTTANFRKSFEIPIQKENSIEKSKILKKLVEPFILRRVKTDKEIIKDLPDKVEQKIYCNLTKEQASLYEAVVKDVEEQIEESEGMQRKGLILATLMKLKQICNHPMQFLHDNSEFTPERSHKLKRITEMVEEVMENEESLLIFSQFREICDAVVKLFRTKAHYRVYYIHGGTSRTKREQMIEEFQNPETGPALFVLSLKAGGVGITLTKANHVFHFDRWWNPAVEDQATDRAFRIGQKKNVFVHKYISMGTLEERIDAMIEEKKKLSTSIVGSDESWLTELDNEAFKKLIALNKNAIMEGE